MAQWWRIVGLLLGLLVSTGTAAVGQDEFLLRPFDARAMTVEEKVLLQTLLAFEGRYNGMLDGAWGQRSQNALDAWALAELGSPEATFLDSGALVLTVIARLTEGGWQIRYLDTMGVSFLLPENALTSPEVSGSGRFVNFAHLGSSLQYSIASGDPAFVLDMHDYTAKAAIPGTVPYMVRRADTLVTSARIAGGRTLYTRSDLGVHGWATVMISASDADAGLMAAVTGSIQKGAASPLTVPDGGLLDRIVESTVAALDSTAEEGSGTQAEEAGDDDANGRPIGSGTGFYVNARGYVLTNRHVVDGCSGLTVDGGTASLIAVSPDYDLALLQAAPVEPSRVVTFAASPARLNSDVTVIGYPLAGLLGGLNVTRGSVSGDRGLEGSPVEMQITAPVQPGNSGGPVVAADGAVVGVVVAKLDAKAVMDRIGDVPQNVNFAIRGEFAKLFLNGQGLQPQIAMNSQELSAEEIAERYRASTVFVGCH